MKKLSQQEEEAMQVIWRAGENTIKAFLDEMGNTKPPYTTLASTIKNLEKKGYLKSRMIGNVYLYKAAITDQEYKKKSIGSLVHDYFDDSYKELVSFFIEQKKLTAKELKELIDIIEKTHKK